MKAALYVRVSTDSQTTLNQRRELEAYCGRQGWDVAQVYDDTGISGAKAERPALNQMLKDAASQKFDVLVVWKIDRLARSTSNLLSILQQLQAAGVGFVATTQQIDTTTAYGRMVLTFLAAIAEFERELIRERVVSGIARAQADGVKCGRPRTGFDVGKAMLMRNEGKSLRSIAKEIGVGFATVHRVLAGVSKTLAA